MALGIATNFVTASNLVVTSSVTLVTTGLTSPIAASQTQNFDCYLPFSVGATGGLRAQLVVPAGGTIFRAFFQLFDIVTPALITAQQAASAAFTNALAVAGSHVLLIRATIVNGSTAGNVDLQMAQNTSDALSFTLFRGAYMKVITT